MKRKIKFRGKDFLGRWHYGYLHLATGSSSLMIQVDSFDSFGVLPETVGQFTGLLDKNGKEIYEGDIMNDPTSMCVGVVEWNSILCQFQLSWQNTHTAADLFFMAKCGSIIIGNIHDNPELLKRGTK